MARPTSPRLPPEVVLLPVEEVRRNWAAGDLHQMTVVAAVGLALARLDGIAPA